MWEYEVMFENNLQDRFFIWGYSFQDACNRSNLNPSELKISFHEYLG